MSARFPLPVDITDARLVGYFAVTRQFRVAADRAVRDPRYAWELGRQIGRCNTRWVQRLTVLRACELPQGHVGIPGQQVVRKIGSCMPAGTVFVPAFPSRCCYQASICPHCWFRQVASYWDGIEHRFFPGSYGECHYSLVARQIQLTSTLSPDTAAQYRNGEHGLRALYRDRAQAEQGRNNDIVALRKAFGSEFGLLEYALPGVVRQGSRRFGWTLKARQLLLVPQGETLPLVDTKTVKSTLIELPTRRSLIWALSWTGRYPRWFYTGFASDVLEAIAARVKLRTIATAGLFRGVEVQTGVETDEPDSSKGGTEKLATGAGRGRRSNQPKGRKP